ncbi:MAG: hypothetical protein CMN44_02750 [SAR116 cluster bacterium]|nr:hypothetical protein [SAR116 cluster bacterium]RPH11155.1 MAG: DUF4149 domain-containing protein [Alphaproteobacteria bacterium TMED54]
MITLIIGSILGFMIFFPVVVAPVVFNILDEKQSSLFLRSFFPKYYLFGILLTLIALIMSIFEKDVVIFLAFTLILVGFLFSRQILTPAINKAKDEIIESNEKSKIKFEKLHKFSVTINVLQMIICIIILFYQVFY